MRTVFLYVLCLLICASDTFAQNKNLDKLIAWLHGKIKVIITAATPRGGPPEVATSLMMVEIDRQHESVLYRCEACWSPAVLNPDYLLVLKADGVWMVPLSAGQPYLAAASEKLRLILGVLHSSPSQILALRATSQRSNCELEFVTVDLPRKTTEPVQNAPELCITSWDLGALPRPDRVRSGQLLADSPPGLSQRRLFITNVKDARKGGANLKPLLPAIDARQDGVDRFDPIWVTDNRVVYAARELR